MTGADESVSYGYRLEGRERVVERLLADSPEDELLRNCYYDRPRADAAERFRQSEEWQAVLALLPKCKGRVLDLGAGHGIASYALAREGWAVIAAEPASGMCLGAGAAAELVRDAGASVTIVRATAETLPFAPASFDVVYARQVLHHTRVLESAIAEAGRILRPGGLFLACSEHVVSSEGQRKRFLAAHPFHPLSRDENAYPLARYVDGIRRGGLDLVATLRPFDSPINYAPYSRASLREQFVRRFRAVPGGSVVARLALSGSTFAIFLKLMSWIDRRPGRAFSFVARKPGR